MVSEGIGSFTLHAPVLMVVVQMTQVKGIVYIDGQGAVLGFTLSCPNLKNSPCLLLFWTKLKFKPLILIRSVKFLRLKLKNGDQS